MKWQNGAWSLSLVGGKSWANLKQNISRPVWLWDHFPASLAIALFSDVSFTDMAGHQSWDTQLSEGWLTKLAFDSPRNHGYGEM